MTACWSCGLRSALKLDCSPASDVWTLASIRFSPASNAARFDVGIDCAAAAAWLNEELTAVNARMNSAEISWPLDPEGREAFADESVVALLEVEQERGPTK